MLEQPFYGLLLLNLQKEFSEKVPTAGVGLQGINYKLYINPTFWQSLNDKERKGLIIHELMHIAFFHLNDYKHLKDRELANIAKDIEINQKIDKEYLPADGC
jgi:predicted metal-dependent peptidase